MPPQKIDTKLGAVGEGDILFVEDWGYTPELWVVEKISPAGLYGFRIQCAVIPPTPLNYGPLARGMSCRPRWKKRRS
jgi:hypothetical protein